MTKSELRKEYLEKRAVLSANEVASMSTSISDAFFFVVNLATVRNLHCYLPIDKFNEPDTRVIFERVWQEFPELITTVPRIDFATGELASVLYSSTCPIVQNKWGVNEPEGGTVVHPEAIDLAIVPLLCFDEAGYRVGYGKGYYDRFLAKCRPNCLKVGLSFFPPVEKIEDTDEFDVPLDLFTTPEDIYRRDAETQRIQTG
jgi:5-formyltetrahydrofolate cyclo-ligase